MKRINKQSIKRMLLLGFSWLIAAVSLKGQSTDENYILKRTYTDTLGHYTTTIQYFDGLGRPYRDVRKDAVSPGVDLVAATEYDSQGRDSVVWLPVKGAGGLPLTDAEIRAQAATLYNNDARPYRVNLYEPSALNRVAESYGPGQAWAAAGKAVHTSYRLNSATDSRLICRKYKVKDDYTLQKQGVYPAASLFVTEESDEDGRTSLVFKNSKGRVLLTRRFADSGDSPLDTYYVYDDHGMLCWVLPPLASDALASDGTWTADADALAKYGYYYRYDGLQLMVEKKLPGCEKTLIFYDKADRVALTQDGNLRAQGKWQYYYYDAFGNVTVTGVCRLPAGRTEDEYRTLIQTTLYARNRFDAGAPLGYTAGSLPVADTEPLRISYYDRYDFLSLPGFSGNSEYAPGLYNAKGRLTGSVSVVYGSSDTLRTVSHYDRLGYLSETVSNNLVGGYDREKTTYTFTGQVKTKEKIHSSSTLSAPQTELYTYTYDDWDKLLTTDHRLNGGTPVRLSTNKYDALGRLNEKKVNNDTYSTAYSYNIRSWQTNLQGSLFTESLFYNTGVSTPCYNGNISSMTWQSGKEGVVRGYKFTYDGLNRLIFSAYGEGAGLSVNPNRYTEKMSYDRMGNISSLQRYGKLSMSSYGLIDDVSLVYAGNQLKNATNRVTGSQSISQVHFSDAAHAETEYGYDGNGNLVSDLNRGISNIHYNLLNLPQHLTFADKDAISYVYDTKGRKLRVVHNVNSSVSRTDYAGNRIYENGKLDKLLTDNGYVTFSGSTPVYHYYLTDHLGNNRVVMHSDGTVEQVNTYYPFGGLTAESSGQDVQPWKYGGKELDRSKGLDWSDYGYRYYEGALGRWTSIDPEAEQYYSWSPYSSCFNNPVKNVDRDGRLIGTFIGAVAGGIKGAYDAHQSGRDIWAGATEGAVAGAITGAIIDVAVATTIASGGSNLVVMGVAVAAGTVGGAVGAVGGDVAGQIVEQRRENGISITADNFAEKATIGAVTGAIDGLSGGAFGIVGKTATASTKALQGTMSSNIATTATALTGQGATQATVNSAVNGITKGMGAAGVNTANSMLKVEAAASTATEVTAKVVEEQIKKKRK